MCGLGCHSTGTRKNFSNMSATSSPRAAPSTAVRKSRVLPPIISSSDRDFLDAVYAYIESEKEKLGCPKEGPDEQRYIIYSSAFEKVIDHATSYKAILSTIKKEYDGCISAIKRSHRDARLLHRKLKVTAAEPTTLMYCQRRAVQLRERIEIIQRDTAELQAQLEKLRQAGRETSPSLKEEASVSAEVKPVGRIPGLSLEESMRPDALTKHLEYLQRKRTELQQKKRTQCVPAQVKADLDLKMMSTLKQRDELAAENDRLKLRYKQMKLLAEAVSCWGKSDGRMPLLDFMSPVLHQASELHACDSDYQNIGTAGFEEDDPSKVKTSELLVDYIERFIELFEAGKYEAAAFHAAKSPYGVLRNMETMEKFKAVSVYQGELPPLLLFFQALTISAGAARKPPEAAMSLEAVKVALQHGRVELVTHWITQRRLTSCEEMGDVIREYGERKPQMSDKCLALAQVVYHACGISRKAALCMCQRGMISGAMEFICHCKSFTLDDCLYLLRKCPSADLLRSLTQEYCGRPAVLSLGFAALSLLSTDNKAFAFQLLERVHSCGRDVFEQMILEDVFCTPEEWSEIADRCRETSHTQLAQDITEILSAQAGAVLLSPDSEDAKLMEHVFL
nr:PREDICTED: clathrin heavy chain linker domain-containing protein 1 isoform X1 [Lepisosteus oculatus]